MQKQTNARYAFGALLFAAAATVALTAIRTFLVPQSRDIDTGVFGDPLWAIIASVVFIAALIFLCASIRGEKTAFLHGRTLIPLSVAGMVAGIVMALSSAWDAYGWYFLQREPDPQVAMPSILSNIVLILMLVFGVLGGVVLVVWGFGITARDSTAAKHGTFLLLPVLWLWFRLARYEMSYASALGLSDCFFEFLMYIAELLFLFKLARFVSNVGTPRTGLLAFYSGVTALLALSAPLVRLCMYLTGDSEAYQALYLVGIPDAAIGLLALMTLWSLADTLRLDANPASAPIEEAPLLFVDEMPQEGLIDEDDEIEPMPDIPEEELLVDLPQPDAHKQSSDGDTIQ